MTEPQDREATAEEVTALHKAEMENTAAAAEAVETEAAPEAPAAPQA